MAANRARRATSDIGTIDAMAMARDERAEMVDLLTTLTPDQWNAPTLCGQWRVRDVVAHMFSYDQLTTLRLIGRLVRGGLSLKRGNTLGVAAHANTSTDDLLAIAKNHLTPRGLTANFGGRIALTDGMIHQQDIRRPLGLPRQIPADRISIVLDFAITAPPLAAAPRIRGLTLTATDVNWTSGDGPEVTGTAEALLLAIAGRRGVTPELSGPGATTLAGRINT